MLPRLGGSANETACFEREPIRTKSRHFARGAGGAEYCRLRNGAARGDAAAQARRCLEIISAALEKAGGSMAQVVRTRTLLTRIEDRQAVAAVHGEFFREIRPANTIMQITRFIDSDWLVEFEADAVIDEVS